VVGRLAGLGLGSEPGSGRRRSRHAGPACQRVEERGEEAGLGRRGLLRARDFGPERGAVAQEERGRAERGERTWAGPAERERKERERERSSGWAAEREGQPKGRRGSWLAAFSNSLPFAFSKLTQTIQTKLFELK
jgi:hypothetical protein